MPEALTNQPRIQPAPLAIVKVSAISFSIAIILLITAILPAEYGIDPTGLGKIMGLDRLNSAATQAQTELASSPGDPIDQIESTVGTLTAGRSELRSDTLKITLMPGQGAEIKAPMQLNDSFVFSWQAEGGSVSFDMHGDHPNSDGAFTSHESGEGQAGASGTFIAPFDGNHGWYWENEAGVPVEVTIRLHGFYGDLYMP